MSGVEYVMQWSDGGPQSWKAQVSNDASLAEIEEVFNSTIFKIPPIAVKTFGNFVQQDFTGHYWT